MKTILSRTNPEIKHLAALQAKKYRTTHGQFIAEGIRTCTTLIEHGHIPLGLYVTEQQLEGARTLTAEQNIILVSDPVMEKISTASSPSGMVGLFTIPKPPAAQKLSGGLVLAQVADPGNTGTLMRTAAALNVQTIIMVEGADPWSPKVVQASAGTIGMLNIFQWSWPDLLKNKGDLKLHALVVSGGKNPRTIVHENALIVVGSEAHGLPEEWVAACDERVTIPMPGGTESLNAAVAGSIALYLAHQPYALP